MFHPHYHISAKLLENIKQITLIVADFNRKKNPDALVTEFEKNAHEISSYSSNSIQGNPLALAEVKKILKDTPEHAKDSEKEILNYDRTLQELNTMIEENTTDISLNLILKVHKGIMKGLIPKEKLGKLRNEPISIDNEKTGKLIYLPPDYKDITRLLNELITYTQKNRQKIDPLILSGIFHKQLVIIHPFIDGNGRTTRLMTKLLLSSLGLNTFNLFSFENYYNKNVTQYFQKVGVFGNYYEIKDTIDFTSWLEYFTKGIIDELLRVQKNLHDRSITPENDLKPFHLKMLNTIEKKGYINDAEYAKLVKRAKATRNLDFKKMIELEKIQRYGKGKNTYYKLT